MKNLGFKFKNFIIFLLSFVFIEMNASASFRIIRDAEIEDILLQIAMPIFTAARIDKVHIYVIDDDRINAFTEGKSIFVNSGLILKLKDPDSLRGVLAHEVGHILSKHIVRGETEKSEYLTQAILSACAIGLLSIATKNFDIMGAGIMGVSHYAERSILRNSRMYESAADQIALKLLQSSKCGSNGLRKFLQIFKSEENISYVNQYELTHPMTAERLAIVNNNKNSDETCTSASLYEGFNLLWHKLWAFTHKEPKVVISTSSSDMYGDYAKAIANFRLGNISESLKIMDALIQKNGSNPYFYEMKGQILFESGKNGMEDYRRAATLRPDNALIRLGKAIVGITTYQNMMESKLQEFNKDLKFVVSKDENDMIAWHYLSIYYDLTKNYGEKLLTLAIIALKYGENAKASSLAKEALKSLPYESVNWYKAGDIVHIVEKSLSYAP